ncbi:unnamed protein product, partial [Staurois parvus]
MAFLHYKKVSSVLIKCQSLTSYSLIHQFSLFPPGTDPQLYVTIVISVLIVLVATGIIIKFCCERRQKRRRNRNERCALPEEGSLQPLTDLSPDSDIPGLHPLKLGDFNKSGLDERSVPCRTSK